MEEILIIQMGGVIDMEWRLHKGKYEPIIGEPAVKRILNKLKPGRSILYKIHTVCHRSGDVTEEDWTQLYEAIESFPNKKIVVTHDVNTLAEAAMQLAMKYAVYITPDLMAKSVVFVGSFSPERFQDSDADFNFGVAIGAVQAVSPGIYVAMNGMVFQWDKVDRDESGLFVPRRKRISICI